MAELAALHLARHLGQLTVAADEGAAEIGAARDVAPPHVLRARIEDLLRAPALHLLGQRRAGAAERAHAREVAAVLRDQPGLHAVAEVGRARAEESDLVARDEAPQHAPVGLLLAAGRVAVVDADGGAEGHARELRVPHHPAGGAVPVVALAEVVGAVARAHVVVQAAGMHGEDDAALAVHDGLGQAGGAARVDDPDRMVEGQRFGFEGRDLGVVARGGPGPVDVVRHLARGVGRGHEQQPPHARQLVAQFLQHGAAVERLAAVVHAVDRDQQGGLDLAEAVGHGGRAHVGRAHAPDRADARAGEKGHHGLGHVGHVGRDAVAALHAERLQRERDRRDLAPQLGPRQLAHLAAFVVADDGGHAGRMGRVDVAQHLARIVDLGPGEPARTRHARLGEHGRVRRGRLDAGVVPDALPEGIELGDGPAPQGVVVVESEAARLAQPVLIEADLGDVGSGHGASVAP